MAGDPMTLLLGVATVEDRRARRALAARVAGSGSLQPTRPRPGWWISLGYTGARAANRSQDVIHRAPACPVSDLNVPWLLVERIGLGAALDVAAIRPHMRLCQKCFTEREIATMGAELAYYVPPKQSLPDRMEYAKQIAGSPSMPEKVRGKPESVLLLLDLGDALMVRPGVAFTHMHVQNGVPVPDAHLTQALVRRAGHRCRVWEGKNEHGVLFATAEIVRKDDPDFPYRVTWDLDRARNAGLLDRPAWKAHPQPNLKRRAVTECIRDACPEVLMGMDIDGIADSDFIDLETTSEVEQPTAAADDDVQDAEIVPEPGEPAIDPQLQEIRDEVKVLVDTLGWSNSAMKRVYFELHGGDITHADTAQLRAFRDHLNGELAAREAKGTESE